MGFVREIVSFFYYSRRFLFDFLRVSFNQPFISFIYGVQMRTMRSVAGMTNGNIAKCCDKTALRRGRRYSKKDR